MNLTWHMTESPSMEVILLDENGEHYGVIRLTELHNETQFETLWNADRDYWIGRAR